MEAKKLMTLNFLVLIDIGQLKYKQINSKTTKIQVQILNWNAKLKKLELDIFSFQYFSILFCNFLVSDPNALCQLTVLKNDISQV